MSTGIVAELPWLWAGLTAYLVATFVTIWGVSPRYSGNALVKNKSHETVVLVLLALGVVLLAVAISARWVRIGHGPWISLFELLMSQLWSLGLIFLFLYWRLPGLRPSAVIVLPVMWILGSWVLTLEPSPSHFPATYYNAWKWSHVGLGKMFLGLLLVAVGLGGVMILRRTERGRKWFSSMPSDMVVDRLAWRFMMLALVFDSLMLIAGAVWAQDAWGRYWAWDSLETSAFLTWLFLAIGLHVRLSYKVPYWASGLLIIGVFFMAFATYFGTPYISPAAHKGVI
ncbi:MAG: cytochrome c biogenesis protein CcsA [Gammaproteobacteria bacterium]|nr:cytochrome c biogenesis protein CcsA [Gammaproteobacteria bacterium]MDH5800828.1 cytochrome c biogenesis protein CcsA [Gammaproteobacteria bacterium]